MYNEQKATQAAARFLALRGGWMDKINLMKLMYIADREALRQWGSTITSDMYVSMNNGPVLSRTYDVMKSDTPSYWSSFIQKGQHHELLLIKESPCDALSQKECALIDELFKEYGQTDQWELVQLTHSFKEWRNPNGSTLPISLTDILSALSIPHEQQEIILEDIQANEVLERLLQEFA
jgi:uncharacterized phage-associated protein